MRSHGQDDETAVLAADFIRLTDFHIRLGITYIHFIDVCQCFAVMFTILCNTDLQYLRICVLECHLRYFEHLAVLKFCLIC